MTQPRRGRPKAPERLAPLCVRMPWPIVQLLKDEAEARKTKINKLLQQALEAYFFEKN